MSAQQIDAELQSIDKRRKTRHLAGRDVLDRLDHAMSGPGIEVPHCSLERMRRSRYTAGVSGIQRFMDVTEGCPALRSEFRSQVVDEFSVTVEHLDQFCPWCICRWNLGIGVHDATASSWIGMRARAT